MENANEIKMEPGRTLGQPGYAPLGLSKSELLRQDPRYKSPVLATLMSVIPGLGQIYVGYYQQGFINIVVIAGLITLLASNSVTQLTPFFALFMAFYWFYNLVDAYRKATFYDQALLGLGALDIPEMEKLPRPGGSIAGGLLLVVIGAIALSYTLFGIPLAWLERWWPMALILMGAFLLWNSIKSRSKKA